MTQMYVLAYFLVCIVCMAVTLVIIRRLTPDMGSRLELRAFRFYLSSYYTFVASNAIWVWIHFGFLRIPGYPFSMINLIAICLASYFWLRYVEIRVNPSIVHNLPFNVISRIPLIAAIILIATTPVTKLVFYYNENNEYVRGSLYFIMFLLAIIYIFAATFHLILDLRLARTASRRRHQYLLIVFMIFPTIAGMVDILIADLPIMELSLLFGTFIIYSSMQKMKIYQDELTGLSNRRFLDEYLPERIAYSSPETPLYFFLADVNSFKYVNDQFGHVEGDHALQLIGRTLHSFSSDARCHVARWAGDEFVIIADSGFTSRPEMLISSIGESLEKAVRQAKLRYPLSLSIGFSTCVSPYTSVQDLIKQADQKMYEAKGRHGAAGRQGY